MRTESPLILYVDPNWRRDMAHTPLLNSYWGPMLHENSPFVSDVLSTYPFDASQYKITENIQGADAVLFPYRYRNVHNHLLDIFNEAIDIARANGKYLIIDAMGDAEYDIRIPEAIILKYGGYRFAKKDNEIILPPYADDLLERYCSGVLSPREKRDVPIIGFAGWVAAPFIRRLYWGAKELPARMQGLVLSRYGACRKGIFIRRAALRSLKNSRAVEAHILARTGYSGNVKTVERDIETLRKEFFENALESDLCLDVRGDANNSTRLFEVLSLGRVPIIIDTERNFPFSDELEYRTFSIIVDFRDIKRLPEIVRQAYDAISLDEWRVMQEKARAAYREWFRPDAMTRHLMRAIRAKIDVAH